MDLTDRIHTDIHTGKNTNSKITGEELVQMIKRNNDISSDCLIIYTDGSKIPASPSVGSAFYVIEEEMGYYMSMNKVCSNYTAEACAIAKTLQWLNQDILRRDVMIFTDSKSCVEAVQNNNISMKPNQYIIEIRKRYQQLARRLAETNNKAIIAWIPAHSGIYGNEVVDGLAKEATVEESTSDLSIPIKDIAKVLKLELYKDTQNETEHQATVKGKRYFENFYRKEETYPWFQGINED